MSRKKLQDIYNRLSNQNKTKTHISEFKVGKIYKHNSTKCLFVGNRGGEFPSLFILLYDKRFAAIEWIPNIEVYETDEDLLSYIKSNGKSIIEFLNSDNPRYSSGQHDETNKKLFKDVMKSIKRFKNLKKLTNKGII